MTTQTQEQKVARHVQEVTGLLYTTCLAATRSARLRVEDGPDFTKRWQDLAIRDAQARGLTARTSQPKATTRVYVSGEDGRDVPKQNPRAATLEDFVAGAGMPPDPEPYSREWREQWRKTVAEQRDAERQSRGVEGELKPLPKRRKS